MTTTTSTSLTMDNVQKQTRRQRFKDFAKSFCANKGAVVGLVYMVIIILLAIFAPLVAPYNPDAQFSNHLLQAPQWQFGAGHFFLGTDEAGRDILSRLLYGGRLSLSIGAAAVIITMVPGVILGLLAAFYPRVLGTVIMRISDIMYALPSVLLAIALIAIFGTGIRNAMLAIGIVGLPSFVRIVRSVARAEIKRDYVTANRVAGAGPWRQMVQTILPNCTAPIIVQVTLFFSSAILDVAALGFLGLGVQPPAPEWGTMLSTARDYITTAWWTVTWPGLAILLTVLAINLVGDGLRDALDPKLKKST